MILRDPPRPEGQEDRQDHRELLREDRHRQGDPGQNPLDPVHPGEGVHHHDDDAEQQPDQGDRPDKSGDLTLQPGLAPLDGRKDAPDLPHLGPDAGGPDLHQPLPLHDQRPGVDEGLVVPARPAGLLLPVPGDLPDRDRLPGQQRLVDQQVGRGEQDTVRRDAVPLGEDEHVPGHDLAPGDPPVFAVADHQGPRRGEIPECLQRMFGLLLLVDRDADDQDDEAHQHHPLGEVPEHEIDQTAGDQEEKDRLPDHPDDDPEHALPV